MVLELVRRVVALVAATKPLPEDWTQAGDVAAWLDRMTVPAADLIVLAARQLQDRDPRVVGVELHAMVASEAELARLDLPPGIVEAIVQLLLYLIERFARRS